jgi:Na+-transporting methylmalonyl-CoA/oxaloacetate decarboxylase gamma subunit
MLVGMGTVFVFLTTLVFAMSLMAMVTRRLQPSLQSDDISNEEIAAIGAAIRRHRNL